MTRSRGHPSSPSEHRVCHSCHTDVTSQWRYGTNDVLLCNACGIRWKRQNRSTQPGRVKPGPKCARPSGADSSSYPRNSTGSPTPSGHRSKMDLGSLVDPSSSDSSRRGHNHHAPRSQAHPAHHGESPTGHGQRHRACASISPRVSPIAISNLINVPDEGEGRAFVSGSFSN